MLIGYLHIKHICQDTTSVGKIPQSMFPKACLLWKLSINILYKVVKFS